MRAKNIFTALLFSMIAVFANASDEIFRAWLIEVDGENLTVETTTGNIRDIRISSQVVVASRIKSTTDLKLIPRGSRLQISMNRGSATTIVIEEVPE